PSCPTARRSPRPPEPSRDRVHQTRRLRRLVSLRLPTVAQSPQPTIAVANPSRSCFPACSSCLRLVLASSCLRFGRRLSDARLGSRRCCVKRARHSTFFDAENVVLKAL